MSEGHNTDLNGFTIDVLDQRTAGVTGAGAVFRVAAAADDSTADGDLTVDISAFLVADGGKFDEVQGRADGTTILSQSPSGNGQFLADTDVFAGGRQWDGLDVVGELKGLRQLDDGDVVDDEETVVVFVDGVGGGAHFDDAGFGTGATDGAETHVEGTSVLSAMSSSQNPFLADDGSTAETAAKSQVDGQSYLPRELANFSGFTTDDSLVEVVQLADGSSRDGLAHQRVASASSAQNGNENDDESFHF